jgi:hypothetical protein
MNKPLQTNSPTHSTFPRDGQAGLSLADPHRSQSPSAIAPADEAPAARRPALRRRRAGAQSTRDAAQVEGGGGRRRSRGAGLRRGPLHLAPPPHRGRRVHPGRQCRRPRSRAPPPARLGASCPNPPFRI